MRRSSRQSTSSNALSATAAASTVPAASSRRTGPGERPGTRLLCPGHWLAPAAALLVRGWPPACAAASNQAGTSAVTHGDTSAGPGVVLLPAEYERVAKSPVVTGAIGDQAHDLPVDAGAAAGRRIRSAGDLVPTHYCAFPMRYCVPCAVRGSQVSWLGLFAAAWSRSQAAAPASPQVAAGEHVDERHQRDDSEDGPR
jgi:hypothetical protein